MDRIPAVAAATATTAAGEQTGKAAREAGCLGEQTGEGAAAGSLFHGAVGFGTEVSMARARCWEGCAREQYEEHLGKLGQPGCRAWRTGRNFFRFRNRRLLECRYSGSSMNASELPTPWQRKTLWNAVTAIAVVVIGAIAVGLIWLTSRVLGFLQPILIPFAVAAVMAYLLEPVVERIQRWGTTRRRAVLAVFSVLTIAVAGILLWILPTLAHQTDSIVRKVPGYSQRVKNMVLDTAHKIEAKTGFNVLPPLPLGLNDKTTAGMGEVRQAESTEAKTAAPDDATTSAATTPEPATAEKSLETHLDWGRWVQTTYPVVLRNLWQFITVSVGGFLGVFGFLLSLVIVPVYLWYFLIESRNIAVNWGDYVPLTKSAFKDEVVSTIDEINGSGGVNGRGRPRVRARA